MTKLNEILNRADDIEKLIIKTFRLNTLEILKDRKSNQTSMAKEIGVSESAVSKALKINSTISPALDTIVRIAAFFDISFEELCLHPYNEEVAKELGQETVLDKRTSRPVTEYDKYVGIYEGIYFDTSKPIGGEHRATSESFSHVVLIVFKAAPNMINSTSRYCVVAYFNCTGKHVSELVSGEIDKFDHTFDWEAFHRQHSEMTPLFYWGDINLSDQFAYVDLYQKNSRDAVHIILHNKAALSSASKSSYIGGLGVMASCSRGEARMPCVQQIILSKYPLVYCSEEELATQLYTATPNLNLDCQTEDFITWVKALYIPSEEKVPLQQLGEQQKIAAVQAQLKLIIQMQMQQNAFRYCKISSEQDAKTYSLLSSYKNRIGST